MRRDSYVMAAAAMTIGLVAAACSNSSDSGKTATVTVTTGATSTTSAAAATTSTSAATTTGSTDLQSLLPTPASTQRTDGPEPLQENGIHEHYLVNGSPADVMGSYKAALEGKGWSVTVENSGGGGGGGGANYTGTNGGAYGVFTGGGYGGTTDVNACAWPSKPSNTDCGQHN